MDFSASSPVVRTNSQLSCFGEQPVRTRKTKTPKRVAGQQRLLRRGRSAGMPVTERSLEVVGDHCRRQSAGVLRRTATAQPSPSNFAGLNVRFEKGDITVDHAELRKSVISLRRQFLKSYYGDLNYLSNPELDRTEFAQRVGRFACGVCMISGCAVTAALLLYAAYAMLDHLSLAYTPPDGKADDLMPFWIIWYSSALFVTAGLSPLIALLSYDLSNIVADIVDAYEKKVASTNDGGATEQFLKKYDRTESWLDSLNTRRFPNLTKTCRKSERDLSKLVVNVNDGAVDGKPQKHVTVKEKPKFPLA